MSYAKELTIKTYLWYDLLLLDILITALANLVILVRLLLWISFT